MKERPTSDGRSRMWRRLRSAALCRAPLRCGGARKQQSMPGWKEPH